MNDVHVARELAGTNADEGESIPVLGIHIRLNLENKTRESRVIRLHLLVAGAAGLGRTGIIEESIQHELHAEVIDGAAKEDGSQLSVQHRGRIEARARAFEHSQFLQDLVPQAYGQLRLDGFVFQIQDLFSLTYDLRIDPPTAERINVPGTTGDHNWTYRIPVLLESLPGHEWTARIAGLVEEYRDRYPETTEA